MYQILRIVVIPFKAPDLSTIRYNDNDFVSYKQGYIKKAVFIQLSSHLQQKSIFGMTYSVRYGILTKVLEFVRRIVSIRMYLQSMKKIHVIRQLLKLIYKILLKLKFVYFFMKSIHDQEEDRGVYPFIIHQEEGDVMLGCEDDSSRKYVILEIIVIIEIG